MRVYYNEWEPYPAQWLRNLIKAGHLPEGDVDERDIKSVQPDDLKEYAHAHFFAGIGGWPLALKLAGWPDERPVWTGSCPCQPFSVAGKQNGHQDERHLWPEWFRLIQQFKPATIFGEQVSGAIAHGWLDDVYQGLEKEGYAFGSAVLPACSVGAPHRRDRLWFVADTSFGRCSQPNDGQIQQSRRAKIIGTSDVTSNPEGSGWQQGNENIRGPQEKQAPLQKRSGLTDCHCPQTLADPIGKRGCSGNAERQDAENAGESSGDTRPQPMADAASWRSERSGAQCNVGRLQETLLRKSQYTHNWNLEPAVGRVANGISARSHKLRAYGNAIVPQVAQAFIEAFLECRP